MRARRLNTILWELIVFFSWLPGFAYAIGNQMLVSTGIYTVVFLVAASFVYSIFSKSTKNKLISILLLFALYFSFVLIKVFYFSEGTVRALLYLGMIMMAFCLCMKEDRVESHSGSIYRYPLVLSFLMFALSFNSGMYEEFENGKYWLKLRYQNPNILSYVLLIMLIYIFLGYLKERKKIYLMGAGICLYLIILTVCRASLLGAAAFILLETLKVYKRKIAKVWSVVATLIPILSVVMILALRTIEMRFRGKTGWSGRDVIWSAVIEAGLKNKSLMFIGRNSIISNFIIVDDVFSGVPRNVLENAHNAYMQSFCNYGILVTLLLIAIISICMIKAGNRVKGMYSYTAYCGIVAIMINNAFETHMIDGITGMTFLWILLYKLAREDSMRVNYDSRRTRTGIIDG